MQEEHVDFLNGYLESYPELRDKLKTSPPSVFWRGRWRRLIRLRKIPNGLEVCCRGGSGVRIFPADRAASFRVCQRGGLLALIEKELGPRRQLWEKTDRNQHQTGAFLRGLFGGVNPLPVVAVYDQESPDLLGRLLSACVLWWDRLPNQHSEGKMVLFLPECWGERILSLVPYLSIPILCFKYSLSSERVWQVYPHQAASSNVGAPYVIYPVGERVPSLFVELSGRFPFLDLVSRRGGWEVSYRGLPLVWNGIEGSALFDYQKPKPVRHVSAVESHILEVAEVRKTPSPHPEHFFFRFGEERWLESLILRNHHRVCPLFAGDIYSQVPTWVGPDRKVIDLLTVTNAGRLAVLELKTRQDLNLLFQGLDYWDRVEQHLMRGDFRPAGYFPEVSLKRSPPLLFLICPLFEFHRTLGTMRRYLKRDVEIQCIGINTDWKRELRFLRRFEL